MWPLGMELINHPRALVPELAAGFVVGLACGYAIRARISARRKRRSWRPFYFKSCENRAAGVSVLSLTYK